MQKGQAIIESMILMMVLASLFIGIMWLGQLQDIGLQLSHASRNQAFKFAYQKQPLEQIDDMPINLSASNWHNRQGNSRVNNLSINTVNTGQNIYANSQNHFNWGLHDELKLGSNNIWRINAYADIGDLPVGINSIALMDRLNLGLTRFTAILPDTNSIADDQQVHLNLSAANTVWKKHFDQTVTIGKHVNSKLTGVDKAWGRALPKWDWLSQWESELPARHLKKRVGNEK